MLLSGFPWGIGEGGGFVWRALDLRGLIWGLWDGGVRHRLPVPHDTSVLPRKTRIGTPGEVDRYTLVRKSSSGGTSYDT